MQWSDTASVLTFIAMILFAVLFGGSIAWVFLQRYYQKQVDAIADEYEQYYGELDTRSWTAEIATTEYDPAYELESPTQYFEPLAALPTGAEEEWPAPEYYEFDEPETDSDLPALPQRTLHLATPTLRIIEPDAYHAFPTETEADTAEFDSSLLQVRMQFAAIWENVEAGFEQMEMAAA
jgi:hypothetical protein